MVCVGARGSRHAHTLISIYNYADLLMKMGDERGALPLFMEELEGCAARFGVEHKETQDSAKNAAKLLAKLGQKDEALKVKQKYGLRL